MRVSRRGGALVFSICSLARAESSPKASDPFTVERGPGAETCPSGAELLALVERIQGRPARGTTVTYQVSFTRDDSFSAEISATGSGSGSRVLRDGGQTCETLAQATAVTLSLLLDSNATAERELTPRPRSSERAAATLPPSTREAVPTAATTGSANTKLTLSLGGVALFGTTATASPGVEALLGLEVKHFRTSIGALWVKPVTHHLAPGTVEEALSSGSARVCVAPLAHRGFRLDLCSGVFVGVMTAEARGYTRNESLSKTWLAVPLELNVGSVSSPARWEIAAAALLPLRRQEFSIDNLGSVYETWPLGLFVSLRLAGGWEF
jgi:hypothetical protein